MKRNVLTYHPNCSTGLGGIETLNRSLKYVANNINVAITEMFNCISIDGNEHYHRDTSAIYKHVPLFITKDSTLREVNKCLLLAIEYRKPAYDALIIFHPAYALFIFPFIKKGRPLVVVQSNKISVLKDNFIMRHLGRRIMSRVDKFVCYTKYDEQELSAAYPSSQHISCNIPRGCKLEIKNRPAHFSKSIVTIARIQEHQKNFTEMIEIVAKLPDVTLNIYGDGSDSEVLSLKEKIREFDNIHYLGATTDVASVLRNHSVFILTSDYEGYGQTLIEARSQGLPIVAYNTFEAAKTIIKRGLNGHLIQPGQREHFRKAVKKLTSDEAYHQQCSQLALSLSDANDNSTIETSWADLLNAQLNQTVINN